MVDKFIKRDQVEVESILCVETVSITEVNEPGEIRSELFLG